MTPTYIHIKCNHRRDAFWLAFWHAWEINT